ncbi:MAG: hypothetical protein AAF242_14195 [Bacteroidota bacterium]
MKNIILSFIIIFISSSFIQAQGQYEAGMGKAFELWGEGKHKEALALFERISNAETSKWIPTYYAANLLVSTAFGIEDKDARIAQLEKAKETLEQAHLRSPENSEIVSLEGLLYMGYVAMDPPTYAMEYGPKIAQLLQKAVALNPDNPRAHANMIEYEMGTAQFFGQDLKPFCERMAALIPKFENQELSEPFAPSYGLDRAKALSKDCQ